MPYVLVNLTDLDRSILHAIALRRGADWRHVIAEALARGVAAMAFEPRPAEEAPCTVSPSN